MRRRLVGDEEVAEGGSSPEGTHVGANEAAVLLQHLPLFATLSAFLFLAIRVGRVSGSDPGTSLTLLRAAGLASVLMGTVIAFLPAIAVWTVVVLNAIQRRDSVTATQRRWAIATEGIIVTIATLIVPIWAAVVIWAIVIFFVVQAIRRKRRQQSGEKDMQTNALAADWVAIATGSLIALFSSADPWLPAEIIVTTSGKSEVAYVVESDSVWTSLMLNDGRTIQIVHMDDIQSRTVCDVNGSGFKSLSDLLDTDTADNPKCPKEPATTLPSPIVPLSPPGDRSATSPPPTSPP